MNRQSSSYSASAFFAFPIQNINTVVWTIRFTRYRSVGEYRRASDEEFVSLFTCLLFDNLLWLLLFINANIIVFIVFFLWFLFVLWLVLLELFFVLFPKRPLDAHVWRLFRIVLKQAFPPTGLLELLKSDEDATHWLVLKVAIRLFKHNWVQVKDQLVLQKLLIIAAHCWVVKLSAFILDPKLLVENIQTGRRIETSWILSLQVHIV